MSDDRDSEKRLYLMFRQDITFYLRQDLVDASARLTLDTLGKCHREQPEVLQTYDKNMQPKIALRSKGLKDIDKAILCCEEHGINYSVLKIEDKIIAMGFGPISRNEMPKALTRMQVFKGFEPDTDVVSYMEDNSGQGPKVEIGYRDDIDIPDGKLIAQAGHAIWACMVDNPELSVSIFSFPTDLKNMEKLKQNEDYREIVDAGRTVFNEPTVTTCGYIKDCPENSLKM